MRDMADRISHHCASLSLNVLLFVHGTNEATGLYLMGIERFSKKPV